MVTLSLRGSMAVFQTVCFLSLRYECVCVYKYILTVPALHGPVCVCNCAPVPVYDLNSQG